MVSRAWRVTVKMYGVALRNDEMLWNWMGVMVAKRWDVLKNTELFTFKGVNLMIVNYILRERE